MPSAALALLFLMAQTINTSPRTTTAIEPLIHSHFGTNGALAINAISTNSIATQDFQPPTTAHSIPSERRGSYLAQKNQELS